MLSSRNRGPRLNVATNVTTDREDPVTGSLNDAVAQWLRARSLAPANYVAEQGRHVGRAGQVEITGDGRDISVGGQVTARVRGTIDLWAL